MRDSRRKLALTAILALGTALPAGAAIVDAGSGGFNDGWATKIYYNDEAARGDSNDRDDPTNALGETNGDFFEIGYLSEIVLTFGTIFTGSGTLTEVTFGDPAATPESASIFVGWYGEDSWTAVDQITVSNDEAQDGFTFTFDGEFDAVRIVDQSPIEVGGVGGFDVDSVRVAPIPLPAGGVLLLTALGGLAVARRKRG